MLKALFAVLQKYPDGIRAGEALQATEAAVTLSDFEKGNFPSGGRRFEKMLRWATVDCVRAGWLVKQDGYWHLTEKGKSATIAITDPAAFYKEAVRLYNEWKATRDSNTDVDPDEALVSGVLPNSQAATALFEEVRDRAREEISAHVLAMDPFEFQQLVGALLTAMDYHVVWISPPGKDDGIDLLAYPDPLGTKSPRIKVQVKRYSSPVPVGDISAFMGILGKDEVGIFVSTGGFTKDAETKARVDTQHRVTLIGLQPLIDLWAKHYEKLGEVAKARLRLVPVYFLAPEN